MGLFLHILFHFLISLIAGIIVWKIYPLPKIQKKISPSRESCKNPEKNLKKVSFHNFWCWVWNGPMLAIISALIGGVAVDFDHFFDYFIAFGFNFKLSYFANGYQFLKTDKLYLLFHGWEYVIILLVLVLVLNNRTAKKASTASTIRTTRTFTTLRTIFLGLALGLFFHLITDVNLNKIPATTYSIVNRYNKNFSLEKLVTPEHWERHKLLKSEVGF